MLEIIILAAGEGKRMNSARPKVLQPIGGIPMLAHVLETATSLEAKTVHVVVGSGASGVQRTFQALDVDWVEQKQRLGTGHAAAQALENIAAGSRVLVLPGDMPLIRASTLDGLLRQSSDLAVLSFAAADPTGYGRILRNPDGRVTGIREEADADASERAITEVNSGVLAASAGALREWLARVDRNNAQGEYYLTDCIALAAAEDANVSALRAEDPDELLGANDRAQLARLEQLYQGRCARSLLDDGVTLLAADTLSVRGGVRTGRDVVIDRDVILSGDVILEDEVSIGAGCILSDCELAAGTRILPYSILEGVSTLGACTIGPFARLRPGTEIDEGARVGNFVEIKNAQLAAGAKVNHLSYIGDAEVGAGANVGAGTITCNYDGARKHRTTIGPGAFIGSNAALVAPVTIGDNATIGAGSVITSEAPDGKLTVARARQRTIEDWQRPTDRDNDRN